MSIGTCKFCGQEKKLINAHIVPECFYLGLKNKYKYVNFDANLKSRQYKIYKKGGMDKNILCAECDGKILGKLDNEGKKVLLENFSKYKCEYHYSQKIYKIDNSNYDYNKLRKFFISILWRASISELPELKPINLGKYEKIAFDILKDKKEHKELFKILIFKNCYNESLNNEITISKCKTTKFKKYTIQMAGYLIEIVLDASRTSNQYKQLYEQAFLNSDFATIIETLDVSRRIKEEYDLGISKLQQKSVDLSKFHKKKKLDFQKLPSDE